MATTAGKKFPQKIVKKNEFIGCHQESDYWPLKPKIFSTFDDVFIIICTDNEPPVQWFLNQFVCNVKANER
jgi:hypothetical protein